ncbi:MULTISPECIES: hypothetical protein [Ralstonia]|uniref:hypothetical protein n=1 Tax=Ralstonia TaxID=48736 RepID=UPI0011AED703|nr:MULTISPECIES: hypothetical protein [Ralstonia]
MELKLEIPLRLHLDVCEVDEHLPSMRVLVAAEVQQARHTLVYRGSLWFDCSSWDAFVSRLTCIEEEAAELADMGGHFVLRIGIESGTPQISWKFESCDMTGKASMAACRSHIDADEFAHVRRQFTQFQRWW